MESKKKPVTRPRSQTLQETFQEIPFQELISIAETAIKAEERNVPLDDKIQIKDMSETELQEKQVSLKEEMARRYALLSQLSTQTQEHSVDPKTLGTLRAKLRAIYRKNEAELFLYEQNHPKWLPHVGSYLRTPLISDKRLKKDWSFLQTIFPLQKRICQLALEKMPDAIQSLTTQLENPKHKLFAPHKTYERTMSFDLTKTVVGHQLHNFYCILEYAEKNKMMADTELQKLQAQYQKLNQIVENKFEDFKSVKPVEKSDSASDFPSGLSASPISASPHSLSSSAFFLQLTPEDASPLSPSGSIHNPQTLYSPAVVRKLDFGSSSSDSTGKEKLSPDSDSSRAIFNITEGSELSSDSSLSSPLRGSQGSAKYVIIPSDSEDTQTTDQADSKSPPYYRYIRNVAGAVGVLACLTSLVGYSLQWGLNNTTLTQSAGFDLVMSRLDFSHHVTAPEIIMILAFAIAIAAACADKKSQKKATNAESGSRFCCFGTA